MSSRPLPLHTSAPETTGEVVRPDFGGRPSSARRCDGAADGAAGGFPFALLGAAIVGGVALGVAAWAAGAPGWSAALLGWLSSGVLTPTLPLAPIVGDLFWNEARVSADLPQAEIVPHPRAADIARWEADLAAERAD